MNTAKPTTAVVVVDELVTIFADCWAARVVVGRSLYIVNVIRCSTGYLKIAHIGKLNGKLTKSFAAAAAHNRYHSRNMSKGALRGAIDCAVSDAIKARDAIAAEPTAPVFVKGDTVAGYNSTAVVLFVEGDSMRVLWATGRECTHKMAVRRFPCKTFAFVKVSS